MNRIRLTLPKRQDIGYRNLDILHDALVNAWIGAGAESDQVMGVRSRLWNFAALGWRHGDENRVHTLVVSTADSELGKYLQKINPPDVKYVRALTSEMVDFSRAEISDDPDPIGPGQKAVGVVMLSPLAISKRGSKKTSLRWYTSLNDFDLSSPINYRLSRLIGRTVNLCVEPDRLYLRAHPKHDTLVQTKEFKNRRRAFVIGMRAPLVLQGTEEDLRLAWYAGIGEKNRNGFGCIGLAERGIGR